MSNASLTNKPSFWKCFPPAASSVTSLQRAPHEQDLSLTQNRSAKRCHRSLKTWRKHHPREKGGNISPSKVAQQMSIPAEGPEIIIFANGTVH